MKAAVLSGAGEELRIEERPEPSISRGEAVVELQASAFNRRDHWISIGAYPGLRLPAVLGSDGCGVVSAGPGEWLGREALICPSLGWGGSEAGPGPGFQILGMPSDGTFAEKIAVPVENLFEKPPHLSQQEAAALPLAGLTAWRAVRTKAQVKAGERVLVTGIGGGVALAALDFSVASDAEVYVTSHSDEKIRRAVERGAAGGVRYDEQGWRKRLPDSFDVIIDSAGGDGVGELVRLLGMAGRFVFYGGTRGAWPSLLPQHLFFRQISIIGSTMGSPLEFGHMCKFVGEKRLRPAVDETYQLNRVQEGMERLLSADRFGKVVLDIQG